MKSSLGSRVKVKLFAGFINNPDMKREMFTSDKWHMAQIAWKSQDSGLEVISFQNKEYVGKYLDSLFLSLTELRDIEDKIKKQLFFHCPKIKQFPLKFYVFPQVFVS
ncbi:MAG: hypothetical protein K940chlam3_00605 [Chlamydiae bacterium]|nr:hypothetical protein [Chlamydiota bacterium]